MCVRARFRRACFRRLCVSVPAPRRLESACLDSRKIYTEAWGEKAVCTWKETINDSLQSEAARRDPHVRNCGAQVLV